MSRKFGQTWWGHQWLNAFNGIDYGNRLPRGARYARSGAVSGIAIKPRGVEARVQGTRLSPYRVKISLNVFTAAQRKTILQAVQQNPALLSRLLNRELPAQLLKVLDQKRISLFPASWQDMHATCTCPDWAVPCKHIAAVIYLIASEIDKNPFMVFTLHDLDLVAALEKATGFTAATLTPPPLFTTVWTQPTGTYTEPGAHAPQAMDLARIPRLGDRLFAILTPAPLFHDRDFHQLMAAMYRRVERVAARFGEGPAPATRAAETLETVTCVIDETGELAALQGTGDLTRGSGVNDFMEALHGIPAALETRLSPHLLLWTRLYRLASRLARQSAFIPAVFTTSEGATQIQWRPATLSPEVSALVTALYPHCPADLVTLRHGHEKAGNLHADGRNQVQAALNLFLAAFARMALETAPAAVRGDPLAQLFFGSRPLRFDDFESAEHPLLIQHWLSRLSLGERDHRLCLAVTIDPEDPASLALSIEVESDEGLLPLAGFLERGTEQPGYLPVLADLAVLADYLTGLETLYGDAPVASLHLDLAAFTPVFTDILPAVRMLGVQVRLPKSLQKLAYPRLNLALDATARDSSPGYLNLDQLLHFDWRVALGDQRVSAAEFGKLIEHAEGLIHIHGQYVMLDDARLRALLKKLEKLPESLSRTELLKAGLSGELAGASVDLGENARGLFDKLLSSQPTPLPTGLQATLRPYQQRGFEWLVQNARIGFGSLLADDMGLGKTIQVIALLLHQLEQGQLERHKVLVIAPTSLLTNWQKELQRFAPALHTHIYHGGRRALPQPEHQVILTSYALARSDQKTLAGIPWRTLVLDEAQNIKNPGANQTRAIKQYRADIRIAMSGTPVENWLSEYWSLFDFVNRGYLGTQKQFGDEFAAPIERERDQQALQRFRRITAPFILRRLKSDRNIIGDLPQKIEGNRYCTLSRTQGALYQKTVDALLDEVSSSEEAIERQGRVFRLLNALKQICNSPAQYLNQARATVEDSGKLAACLEILREADGAGEKALIFTQYAGMGELLSDTLRRELGLTVPFLHGGLSRRQRDAMVSAFQSDRRIRAMVLSLKAGGTGLNLTAASQVIHYDLWWNPAVEAQATDRAYRIGQDQRVQVHRLITSDTLEEKIDQMMQDKKELADLTVGSGEKWITKLSDGELRELVALG